MDRELVLDRDALTAAAWQHLHQPLVNLDEINTKWNLNKVQGLASVPASVQEEVGLILKSQWSTMYDILHEDASSLSKSVRDSLGVRLRDVLVPYTVLGGFSERTFSKPLGYAGDYLTIELIYDDEPQGNSALGLLVDRAYLDLDQAVAVRNRRGVMTNQILTVIKRTSNRDEAARILSLACGPARELFDVCDQLHSSNLMKATLVDIDQSALTYVRSKLSERPFKHQFDLIRANIAFSPSAKTD